MIVDLRFVFRKLGRDRRYLLTTPIMLGLGIAANAILYSLLNLMIFRPLPYPDADKIVKIYRQTPEAHELTHSPADFLDLQRQSKTLAHIAGYALGNVSLSRPGGIPNQAFVLMTSADYFAVLGIPPKLGRTFLPSDDVTGAHIVAVISENFWRTHFAANEKIVGQSVIMNGAPAEIIGVMPTDFESAQLWGSKIDIWLPNRYSASVLAERDRYWLNLIGRLRPGYTIADAQNELSLIFARLAKDFPTTNARNSVRLVPLKDTRLNENTRTMLILVAVLAVALLVLICANLANLQLARLLASANELAIRTALGASPWQATMPLFLESVVISILAGFVGYFCAVPGIYWLNNSGNLGVVQADGTLGIGWDVLLFSIVIALISSFVFGALPAYLTIRHRSRSSLTVNTRTSTETGRQKSVRSLLVTIEVAVGLALISAAVCCTLGVSHLQRMSLGWNPDRYSTAGFYLPPATYPNDDARRVFIHTLDQRLKNVPEIESSAISYVTPVWGYYFSRQLMYDGQTESEQESHLRVFENGVTSGYLSTAGVNLIAGRGIEETDTEATRPVVVVNRTMANQLWPGQDPLGKRIALVDSPKKVWCEVVGVVEDIHPASEIGTPETRLQIYRSIYQFPIPWLNVTVRGRVAHSGLREQLEHVVASIDPDESIYGFTYADEAIRSIRSSFIFSGRVLRALAAFGLLILAFGIYGVLSNSVAQRLREIAIRLTLGATRSSIVWLVFDTLIHYVIVGAVVGLVLSATIVHVLNGLSLVLANSMSQIVLVLAIVGVGMFVFVIGCALVPAYLATLLDPIDTLKGE